MANISDLKFDHKNARKRTDSSARLIQESLQRYGAARSIVIDEDNRILAGNGTIEGAKALGLTKLKVVEAAGDEIIAVRRSGLSEDDKVGLALADNRAAELSDWDAEMLQQLSEEHDIAPWFDQEDLDALLQEAEQLEPVEGNTDPDEVPDAPVDPITKPGDLWILGNHRLLCGDSTNIQHVERLMDGQKADMVFTDPPYALFGNSTGVEGIADDKMIMPFFRDIFSACRTFVQPFGHVYACCDWHSCNAINKAAAEVTLPAKNLIVWDKGDAGIGGMFMNCHELIWFFTNTPENRNTTKSARKRGERPVNGVPNIWRVKKVPPKQREHNAAKPIELVNIGINASSDKGALVLDLFGGSGTTLISAEETGRKCRMMEMEPKYCDVIVKRWEDFTGKKATLEPQPEAF
jgi:DNA modification methylase